MYFIIGDIHGCFDTLMELIKQLPEEANSSNIVFVGDLIDRGPKSREVVEFVKSGGYHCVLGNHEQLMFEGLEEFSKGIYNENYKTWQDNGGVECVESYLGYDKQRSEHIEWFKTLPLLKTFEFRGHKDLLVTHAPSVSYIDMLLNLKKILEQSWDSISQKDRDALSMEVDSFTDWMIWYRRVPMKGSKRFFGVSGHNVFNKHPLADKENYTIIDEDVGFASIDTGVCFPEEPYGILTAIQYPSLKLFQQPVIDKIKGS